jgi:hypothetical protein
MNNSKSIKISICIWALLGFKRGLNSYDYNYPHNKVKYGKEKQHLYLNKVIWGLGAILAYINPGSLPFMLYKEVYRLEVNLRRLEDEKKTDYYNEVI